MIGSLRHMQVLSSSKFVSDSSCVADPVEDDAVDDNPSTDHGSRWTRGILIQRHPDFLYLLPSNTMNYEDAKQLCRQSESVLLETAPRTVPFMENLRTRSLHKFTISSSFCSGAFKHLCLLFGRTQALVSRCQTQTYLRCTFLAKFLMKCLHQVR